MSKSLIKLLDNSLLPASIMILGKFLGVFLTIKISGIDWSIKEYSDNFVSFGNSISYQDVVTVTSYSDLVMYLALSLGMLAILFKAIFFHNTHVKPTLVSRLANRNMLKLVASSYDIYHACVAWISFTLLANIIIISNVVQDTTYLWVGIVTSIASIAFIIVLLQDIYREIENIKKHPSQYSWN